MWIILKLKTSCFLEKNTPESVTIPEQFSVIFTPEQR